MKKTVVASALLLMLGACGGDGGGGQVVAALSGSLGSVDLNYAQPPAASQPVEIINHVPGSASGQAGAAAAGGSAGTSTTPAAAADTGKPAGGNGYINPHQPQARTPQDIERHRVEVEKLRATAEAVEPDFYHYEAVAAVWQMVRLSIANSAMAEEVNRFRASGNAPLNACTGGGTIQLQQENPRIYRFNQCMSADYPTFSIDGPLAESADDNIPDKSLGHVYSLTAKPEPDERQLHIQGTLLGRPFNLSFEAIAKSAAQDRWNSYLEDVTYQVMGPKIWHSYWIRDSLDFRGRPLPTSPRDVRILKLEGSLSTRILKSIVSNYGDVTWTEDGGPVSGLWHLDAHYMHAIYHFPHYMDMEALGGGKISILSLNEAGEYSKTTVDWNSPEMEERLKIFYSYD